LTNISISILGTSASSLLSMGLLLREVQGNFCLAMRTSSWLLSKIPILLLEAILVLLLSSHSTTSIIPNKIPLKS
jgi:hypothetical protein